jgi:predicted nuclease of restriction endonuclease-like RecB superfamily
MLYRAYSLVITARRNEPARYKQLLKYLKFFGLMVTVEGDADFGFTLTLDGPTSLFGSTTRYGLAMAKFLPALLHVTRWDLSAAVKPRKDLAWVDPGDDEWSFQVTSEDGYVSHYPEPKEHDSALESGFTERFAKLDTDWVLEREVDLVPVPGGVILPDFRLVNGTRSVLVEIVGYWRPEYLRKKFELLRKSGRRDLIVCVSERLNLEKAGVNPADFGDRVVWFKGVLNPKDVLAVADRQDAG